MGECPHREESRLGARRRNQEKAESGARGREESTREFYFVTLTFCGEVEGTPAHFIQQFK